METNDGTETAKEIPWMVWMRLACPSTKCLLLYSLHALLVSTNQPKELFCSECYYILFTSTICVTIMEGRGVPDSAMEEKQNV